MGLVGGEIVQVPGAEFQRLKAAHNQLLLGCQAYAQANEGEFPHQLSDLYPDYIDVESFFSACPKEGGELIPLLYISFWAGPKPLEGRLIAYPFASKGRRVVGIVGGQVVEMRGERVPPPPEHSESPPAGINASAVTKRAIGVYFGWWAPTLRNWGIE